MLKPVVLAGGAVLAAYLYLKVYYIRYKQFANIPQVKTNVFLGHLWAFGEMMQKGPGDRHPDYIFEQMHQQLGKPSVMLVDMRPLNYPLVLVTTHHTAEQVARSTKMMPLSTPKSQISSMVPLIGETSLIHANGDLAKRLRKRYAPGFAPSHIMKLLPGMVAKMGVFVEYIEDFARKGKTFEMGTLTKGLTYDIIGEAAMGVDLKGLPRPGEPQGEIVRGYEALFSHYMDDKNDMPWWLAPRLQRNRIRLGKEMDELLKVVIREKHSQPRDKHSQDSRTILGLSIPQDGQLTPELLDETCDQLKTFILAGHDTAATTLSWVFYYLGRTPRALAALREELDSLLGNDTHPKTIMKKLASEEGPEIIRNMTYISAVIKEAMRLEPPGASARTPAPGSGFTIRDENGQEYPLDGTMIYIIPYLIHRDPAAYGETAEHFIPERWLDSNGDIPPAAFQGFGKGPRACIGQDFALAEMKLLIAVLARRYDFAKVGLGELDLDWNGKPVLDMHGVAKVKSEMYSVRQVNPRPVDGMKMKVKLREGC